MNTLALEAVPSCRGGRCVQRLLEPVRSDLVLRRRLSRGEYFEDGPNHYLGVVASIPLCAEGQDRDNTCWRYPPLDRLMSSELAAPPRGLDADRPFP